MNQSTTPTPKARERLTPLLPPGESRPEDLCSADALRRLDEHWTRLEDLGFALEVRTDSLQVRHRTADFKNVLHWEGPDDLGERRRLFASLKSAFGGLRDRFPWIWQPSPCVTGPYESLKVVADVCRTVRSGALRRVLNRRFPRPRP